MMAAVQTETLIDRAAAVLSARRLADADTPALLMVSGELRERGALGQLAMLHVNHRLRGEDADEDARFVAQLAELLDVPLFSCDIDIAGEAQRTGENVEAVLEAIVENLDVKKSLFQELDGICKADTIFATNTSSISMTSLAAATSRPEKVVGMHFFSPVPVMSLVEIVYGLRTSKETIDIVDELGKSMGKRTILAKDKPGFIVNRMLLPMLNEAVQVLDEDIGSVEDVDEGMMRGCNHPMGPLALADMIGLDILLEVMETFYLDLGDTKYRPAHQIGRASCRERV